MAWPDRPVRVVVPFGPGGAIDILIRILAPHFPAYGNGQPIIVDNRPGAGGTIGAAHVAQARADGSTLLMGELASGALAHELYRDLPYDPRRAFTPIVFLADMPLILVARSTLAEKDVASILKAARAKPGGFSFGSVGAGHISHLTMELLQRRAGGGMDMLHVVYRSGADMVAAVAKGEVDLTVTSISSAAPFLQAGTVQTIAVSTPERFAGLPTIPTLSETVPGVTGSLWYGLVGPAGPPVEIVAKANSAFNAILGQAEIADTLRRQQGAVVIGGTPQAFTAHIQGEIERWTPIIRDAGIRVQ
ncbi:MAG: tripartite tricarboxylate transporter substrate binding protein [Roseomonas sp.]|nr:tripartite tricarboxylate transporter substrate binding protein [Roseomonas sp.]